MMDIKLVFDRVAMARAMAMSLIFSVVANLDQDSNPITVEIRYCDYLRSQDRAQIVTISNFCHKVM